MSELTLCNYCTWQGMKAKWPNARLAAVKDEEGGIVGVYVIVDGKKKAWFHELTDHCVC